MSLQLVPPASARTSRTKTCALLAFRAIRFAQAKVSQVPCALLQARNDVVAAWSESRPNA